MVVGVFAALTGVGTFLLVAVVGSQLRPFRQEANRGRRPHLFVAVSMGQTRDDKDAPYLSFTNYGQTPASHIVSRVSEPGCKQVKNREVAFERDSGILVLPPGLLSPTSSVQRQLIW